MPAWRISRRTMISWRLETSFGDGQREERRKKDRSVKFERKWTVIM